MHPRHLTGSSSEEVCASAISVVGYYIDAMVVRSLMHMWIAWAHPEKNSGSKISGVELLLVIVSYSFSLL